VNIMDKVDSGLRRLSFGLLPGRCVLCAQATGSCQDICAACMAELPWNTQRCARCALPLARTEPACGRCLRTAPEFTSAHCAFRYEWPLDGLVTRLKFAADLAAGRVLAELLTQSLRDTGCDLPAVDLIIPVPLHAQRLRERGFNQAQELAGLIARRLAIPLAVEGLQRTRATAQQSGLSALRRRRNVRDAFNVQATVQDLHVAVIDDVVTTAATARECARDLRRAGAASVQIWAVARAPAGRGLGTQPPVAASQS
jgi:ComF family protein